MGRIYTGLAAWNLAILIAAAALGWMRGGVVEPRVHLLAGLFAAIFCCLVHAIVFAHFIGSGKWIKRGVDAAGLDAALVKRTKRFKAKTFPFALFSMLTVVATAVLGGGADSGAVSPGVHLGFAISTLVLNLLATFFERSAILENGRIIERVAAANAERIRQGIAPEMRDTAAFEATRAGSTVFLFLAANTWFLWAYLRFVMRRGNEPWWPYLVVCAVLAWVGLRLRRGEGVPAGSADRP
jgi:heme/copper-type cytochrome/quinol oxidase subunit 4